MLERLTDGFPMKLMGGILFLTLEKQLAMLLLFGILIFLDCFTRWIAISHAHLVSCGRQPTFLEAVCGIREARRQRLISSEIMKKRGDGEAHPLQPLRGSGDRERCAPSGSGSLHGRYGRDRGQLPCRDGSTFCH